VEWVEIADKYGLFVALVVYVLITNWKRENRYISVIETLSDDVKERLTKIEIRLWGNKNE
jgi:Flp pilus assembly pilin Flp